MIPSLLGMWIHKDQHVFLCAILLVVKSQQAAVTVRFDQCLLVGWVFCPGLSQVRGGNHAAQPSDTPFGTHVKHQ